MCMEDTMSIFLRSRMLVSQAILIVQFNNKNVQTWTSKSQHLFLNYIHVLYYLNNMLSKTPKSGKIP